MTHAIPTSVHLDRCAGALLGLAAGDALGAGYEFTTPAPDTEIAMIGGGLGGFAPGEWTDDTAQAAAIAMVTSSGAVDLHGIGARFLAWFADGPADVGVSTAQVLSAADGDPDRLAPAAAAFFARNPRGAAGNGALMRTAPVALASLGDDQAIARDAMAVAALTHGDPLAGEGCVLWCIAIDRAVREGRLDGAWDGLDLLPADRRGFWEDVLRRAEDPDVPLPTSNGAVFTALQAAYGAVVRTSVPAHRPETHLAAVLEVAVRIGGDTDTVAAIAGQLVGARWGASAVPLEWVTQLHGWPELRGQDLVRLAVLTAGGGEDDVVGPVQLGSCDEPGFELGRSTGPGAAPTEDAIAEAWEMLEAQGQMEGSVWVGTSLTDAARRRLEDAARDRRQLVGMWGPDADPAAIADAVLAAIERAEQRTATEEDPVPVSAPDPVVTAAAASFAIQSHGDQVRKETTIPYWQHLAAVAALVAEHGGSSEQVAAAWLHDVVEDCGGLPMLDEVRGHFGPVVAAMVEQLSDSTVADPAHKAQWLPRKQAYLDRLSAHAGRPAMLVSLADKLHNAESIVADLDDPAVGTAVFQRFSATPQQTAWYCAQLLATFREDGSLPTPMLARLAAAVERIATDAEAA